MAADLELEAHRARVEAFRQRRDARYHSADGWLTFVDRIALAPGVNPLPIGSLLVAEDGRAVVLRAAPGVTRAGQPVTGEVAVRVEERGVAPDRFELAGRSYEVTSRGAGGGLNVRVREPEAPARLAFRGIPAFPFDPAWRIVAACQLVEPPVMDAVPRSDGSDDQAPWVAVARFELAGAPQSLRLYADESLTRWFVPFSDPTNGEETYGAGRLIDPEIPRPGEPVVLDFNLAYNLPCAFNSLVACPLPSRHNRLTAPVRAGEKSPA
jgi:uncharacterized protein (DUF1684 family)